MKILLVIPCLNEEQNILSVISEIENRHELYDYIVVNDGSSDCTEELLKEHHINHISFMVNCGLTTAFQAGVFYAKRAGIHYDAICQFDADGQHILKYLEDMEEKMQRENADIIIGSRYALKGQVKENISKKICRKLISKMILFLTGTVVEDPTSGYRLYKDTVYNMFATDDNLAPEPDTLVYFLKKGFCIKEVGVKMNDRKYGDSYLTFAKSLKYMINVLSAMLFVQWWRQ